jgi:hypothetical protein
VLAKWERIADKESEARGPPCQERLRFTFSKVFLSEERRKEPKPFAGGVRLLSGTMFWIRPPSSCYSDLLKYAFGQQLKATYESEATQ